MAKINVSEASGPVLDWAVAKCQGYPVTMSKTGYLIFADPLIQCGPKGTQYSPSTIWAQGGPIIERENIELSKHCGEWRAKHHGDDIDATLRYGPSPLIAAMRSYVVGKLGAVVDVPAELTA